MNGMFRQDLRDGILDRIHRIDRMFPEIEIITNSRARKTRLRDLFLSARGSTTEKYGERLLSSAVWKGPVHPILRILSILPNHPENPVHPVESSRESGPSCQTIPRIRSILSNHPRIRSILSNHPENPVHPVKPSENPVHPVKPSRESCPSCQTIPRILSILSNHPENPVHPVKPSENPVHPVETR
jgi:hypothetical protein